VGGKLRYFNGGKKLTNDMAKDSSLEKRKKELTCSDVLHWSPPGG
jgi:hypothetical protein